MFPRYLPEYLLTDFRQTFVTGAPWDTDDLIAFLGQKVKVQGHTIAAEAHSTRRYRRVQLFLVYLLFGILWNILARWKLNKSTNTISKAFSCNYASAHVQVRRRYYVLLL